MAKSKRPVLRKANRTYDIKKDLSVEQLAGIGAVSLAFTEAEYIVSALIFYGLAIPRDLGLEFTTRVNGIEGRVNLVRLLSASFLKIPQDVRQILDRSLNDFLGHKKDRDLLIHAHIIDAEAGIGMNIGSQAKVTNVLLKAEFLSGIYDRLVLIKSELHEMAQIFNAMGVRARIDPNYLGDLKTGLIGANLNECFVRAQAHQKKRLSLPPLPKLPHAFDDPVSD